MKSYILRVDFQHLYSSAFQQFVIDRMFGGNILLGSDLAKENVEIDEAKDEITSEVASEGKQ